ncbi:MAG: DUF4333 domain-containing protein [Actinobacteria bacterium]|uniref:Unannotated protein n=1 Tax=freshwater metagenome TaxID=449393 RepID=A0A6J6C827_9ZZZZ|nr:DUF4333 domain-containing protein [Actinomycetota bacterium]MTA30178.1 DUF4333 domain-containing protein [Actinomycetota bacterium]
MFRKVAGLALIITLAASTAGCAKLLENLGGGVNMDPNIIEQNIIDTYAKSSVNVSVECPDPFVAKVGESRNCLVTDEYGTTAMAKVTVENADGVFTWVAE